MLTNREYVRLFSPRERISVMLKVAEKFENVWTAIHLSGS